jgi:hypothetical protein
MNRARHIGFALLTAAIGAPSSVAYAAETEDEEEWIDPDLPQTRADASDLLTGHVIITVDGGVWAPSKSLYQGTDQLGAPDAGPTAHARLGFGISRYLMLSLDGGFGYLSGEAAICPDCALYSIDAGPSLVFRPTQGFAFDPWVSYGAGYRHNVLVLDAGNETEHAVDFAKLALGGDFFPAAVFGFGVYLATDVGVRVTDPNDVYAAFHAGLRLVLDPVRSGESLSPTVASASY